jgi:hypothetical protein
MLNPIWRLFHELAGRQGGEMTNHNEIHPYNPQAEREKVLDELEKWLDHINDIASQRQQHPYPKIPIDTVKLKLKELREGKDGE